MEINDHSKVCPICGYEFASFSSPVKWVAILLLAVTLMFLLLQFFG